MSRQLSKPDNLYKIVLPSMVIGIILCFFLKEKIITVFYLNYLFSIACVIFIFSPLGSITLGHGTEQPSEPAFWCWIKIWGFQLCSVLSFFLCCSIATGNFNQSTIIVASSQLSLHYGLFPWTAYAMIAVALCYCLSKQRKNAYFNRILQLNWRKITPLHPHISMPINTSMRICSSLFFATLIILISYGIATIINPNIHFNPGKNWPSIICAGLTIIVMKTIHHKKITAQLQNNKLNLPTFFIAIIVAFTLIILISLSLQTQPNPSSFSLFKANSHARIMLSYYWWGLFLPIATLYTGIQCKNRTIRQALVSSLIIPLIIVLMLHQPTAQAWASHFLSGEHTIIIEIFALIILVWLSTQKSVANSIIDNGIIITTGKSDHQTFFLKSLIIFTSFIIILLSFFGVKAITLFETTFILISFISATLLLGSFCYAITCRRHQ